VLLSRLKTSFGFDGLVYHWIESYLTDCSQTVTIENNSSALIYVASGVSQGSVIGPLLFSIYTSHIASIAFTFLFLSSNLLMTHNFTFLFAHPISAIKIHRLEDCLTALLS